MTDYCHKHSSPIPLRNHGECKLCWLDARETDWDRRRHVAFFGTKRKDPTGLAREAAIDAAADAYCQAIHRAEAVFSDRPDDANAHDPAEVCEAAGFTSTDLVHMDERGLPLFGFIVELRGDADCLNAWLGAKERHAPSADDDAQRRVWASIAAARLREASR